MMILIRGALVIYFMNLIDEFKLMSQFFKSLLLAVSLCLASPILAQENDSLKSTIKYGSKGFEFRTADNGYLMQLEWRLQTRFASPYENDPISLEDLNVDNTYLGINKHRNKLSMEYSFLEFQDKPEEFQDGSRVRLQWDISF